MKFILLRVFGIVFFGFFLWLAFFLGVVTEALKPFLALTERVKLYSHVNYIFLIVMPFLSVGVIALGLYQLLHPKRDVHSYGTHGKYFTVVLLSVLAVALINRIYLGYRVDQADYVKCVNESRTSSKSSWRVYAKDINLCKASSGIAGG